MENDFAWHYGMTAFLELEVSKDSVLGLSSSEQNGCANDSLRDQSQPGPEERFGFGNGLGIGLGRVTVNI